MITLKHNFILPESVLRWLFDANDRGLTFELHADKLRVRPAEGVRPEDDLFIRQHRDLLRACVSYIDKLASEPPQ